MRFIIILTFFSFLNIIFSQTLNPAIIKKIQELNQKQYQNKLNSSLPNKSSIQDDRITESNQDLSFINTQDTYQNKVLEKSKAPDKFFGESFFKNIVSIPKTYGPVPDSYRLGPGDQLIITLYGEVQISHDLTVDRDYNIFPENIGRISVAGLTFGEAKKVILQRYSNSYSTLKGRNPKTELFLTLGNHRKVHVTIIGEVNYPRQVILSSMNTIFDAVVLAGGPTEKAAIRKVAIKRAGKILTYDLYQDIVVSLTKDDFFLEDGDIINITAEKQIVKVMGGVRRSNDYEINSSSTINELIKIAGGLKYNASLDYITVITIDGDMEKAVYLQNDTEFKNYKLKEADQIIVHERLIDQQSHIEIKGSILYPGLYAFEPNKTIDYFIDQAGGLKKDTYTERVDLLRKLDNLEYESYTFGFDDINKVVLKDGDILTFYNNLDFKEERYVNIYSFAQGFFKFPYYQNSDIYDYLSMIGGIKYNEDESFIEVVRLDESDEKNYAKLYNVELKPGYLKNNSDRSKDFLLRPDDNIIIRRNPNFEESSSVKILGEVVSAGSFTITKRDERISDLLKRSKGLKKSAYVDGIKFYRKLTDNFKIKDKISVNINNFDFTNREFKQLNPQMNTTDVDSNTSIELQTHIRIPLDFKDIINDVNSEDNLYLVNGDSIVVTRNPFTVIVEGEVNSPIPVIFQEGKSVEYYIEQAGGLTEFGDDSRIQVIKANGKHLKSGFFQSDKINPGTIITVPPKVIKENTNEILTTIFTSLSTIITTLVLIQQL